MNRCSVAGSALVALAVGCSSGRSPEPAPPLPAPAAAPVPAVTPAPPTRVEPAWVARTADGAVELAQTGAPPATCALEARRGEAVLWTASRCVAERGQPVFLGPDGATAIAVDPFVPRGAGPDGAGPVVVVTRRGEPVRGFFASELAPEEGHMRSDRWLAPSERGPEHAPALTPAGDAVRLETARGAVVTLRFDGAGWPVDRAAAAAAAAAALPDGPDPTDEVTMYRWEDARGEVHYTVASQVPPDRARTARRVTAQIGSVDVERIGVAGPGRRATSGQPIPAPDVRPVEGFEPLKSAVERGRAPPPSTFHVDTVNRATPGGGYLDAGAMDRQYEKQTKDMKCRTVNGAVICG